MVSQEIKNSVREKLGKGLSINFRNYLISKNVKNTKGKDFSYSSVRNYIYKDGVNTDLDKHFLNFARVELKKLRLKLEKKQSLVEEVQELC